MTKQPWNLMNIRTSLVHYRKKLAVITELNENILEKLQEKKR